MRNLAITAATAFLFTIGFPAVSAAQASVKPLEEIVVTARKREERLQDVPIAITAVSGEFARDLNIQHLDQLAELIPNFAINERTGPDMIGIRGISSGANRGFEQTVGLVVDGFFFGRQRFVRTSFLDVERLEILKGPQGALIGKNTTGGAISITTAKPTDAFEGWASFAYELEAGKGPTAEGAISGPLMSGLKGRVALLMEDRDGWVHNLATDEDESKVSDLTSRVSLLWEPSDTLSVLGQWTHAKYQRDGSSNQISFCDADFRAFLQASNIVEDCQANLTRNVLQPVNGQGNFERFDTDIDMAGVTINWDRADYTITSLTGYARMKYTDWADGDRLPLEVLSGVGAVSEPSEDYEQWSQELRIGAPAGGRFEYIAGIFLQHTKQFINRGSTTNLAAVGSPVPLFTSLVQTDQKSDTYAAFGQLTWDWTEQWAVTVDGRFTYEKKEASQIQFPTFPYTITPLPGPFPSFLRTHNISGDRVEKDLSPGLTLQWRPNPDRMFYGSVRRGFKGGGFDAQINLNQADIGANDFQYEDEQVTAYELGTKLTLADGTMQANAAVFRAEFEDLQVSVIDNTSLTVITRVGNAAEAITQGVEFDVTWRPLPDLTFFGAAAYLDATYEDYSNANCFRAQTAAQGCDALTGTQDLRGTPLIHAPEWTASMNAEYAWRLGNGLEIVGFLQGTYSDEFAIVEDRDPFMFQESYWKLDARIALRGANQKWSVSIIGRNLTDELTTQDGNDLPGPLPGYGYHGFVDPPRSIAIQGRLEF